MASFLAQIGLKMPRKREKIKIIVLFRSYTTRNRKLKKKKHKNSKNYKILLWLHFKPK